MNGMTGLFSILFIILILLFPAEAAFGAKEACDMWLNVLVPSLLPCCAAAVMLTKSGILSGKKGAKLFIVYILSLVSGYPNGAHIAGGLYMKKTLDRKAAQKLINATSVCGPSFIICALCSGMFHDLSLIPYIIIPCYLTSFTSAMILLKKFPKASVNEAVGMQEKCTFFEIFTSSVVTALNAMLKILGFTVFFSVLTEVFLLPLYKCEHYEIIKAAVSCLFDLTTGSKNACKLIFPLNLIFASFAASFGGLNVYCQTYSTAKEYGIKISGLLPVKVLTGISSALITYVLFLIFPPIKNVFGGIALPGKKLLYLIPVVIFASTVLLLFLRAKKKGLLFSHFSS